MNFPRILKKARLPYLIHSKLLSTAPTPEDTIVIPKRIPRGPTDILRALESTVDRDPTAPHYKYHDDPYLTPVSNVTKRTYALAQEAGRKAAMWVRNEHRELFLHKEADPPIEAFIPKAVYDENSEVTVEDLRKVVEKGMVEDAVVIYKGLKKKGVEVGEEDRQKLLELVCFYNGEDGISEELIEERWFRHVGKGRDRQRKTWKDNDFAEELFISIDNPDSKAYSALIQGMAKYLQADRAFQLFEEAKQKGFPLNTDTYNSIIRVTTILRDSNQKRLEFIMKIMADLKESGLKPNIGTLNAAMEVLAASKSDRVCRGYMLSLINEFRGIDIEPSLATWYFALLGYYRERSPPCTLLHEILNLIENKEFQIQDVKDTYFFVTAMDICRNNLYDVELANRVHKLLHYGNNYDLIGDSYKESVYYRNYVILLSATTPFEDFMRNTYNTLVPHIYIPEPSVMMAILKDLEASGRTEYLPQLWSDIKIFDQSNRQNILHCLLDIMVDNRPDSQELDGKFSDIAWDIYTKTIEQPEDRVSKLEFTGEMLGGIITLLLRNGEFEKASEAMETLDKNQGKIMGVPKLEALSLFVDECIKHKMPSRAINCIRYCSDSGYSEAANLAAKLHNSLTLDETHLAKLSNVVDLAIVKDAASS